MTPQLSRSIALADRADDQISRMAHLHAMSATELAAHLGSNPETAAPWVAAAAACGMAAAQVQWGRMLLDGTAVTQDRTTALVWFTRAANTRNAPTIAGDAENMVGRCHELGWGTVADPVAAVAWYRRATNSGDCWGMYNLANMLFDGRGIVQDRGQAIILYEQAAHRGHARAMNLLARCLEEGWGAPCDAAAAAEWYCRSAEGGYFRGQYNHGIELLRQGRHREAAAMFQRAQANA